MTGLNRHKYSFPKLISELGVSYLPSRDDEALRATLGNAQGLLTASPSIKISSASSTEVKESSPIEAEPTQNLEQQKEKLRRTIDAAAANRPTFTQFIHRLQSREIKPRVKLTRTGKIQGISFECSGVNLIFSGTELGENYSFKGLQRYFGVDFNLERDVETLAKIVHSNSQRKKAILAQPTENIKKLLLGNQDNLALSMSKTEGEEKPTIQNQKLSSPSPAGTASGEAHSDPLNQLTDAELLSLLQAVERWKKNRRPQPNLVRGENLIQRIDELSQQKAKREKQLLLQERELEELGQPRSLLNPFGVSESVIDGKRTEIAEARTALYDIEFQLLRSRESFQQWQQEVSTYQAWRENPKTQDMERKAEQLKSPSVQERLQRLNEGYAIHAAAQYILVSLGEPKDNPRYFQGKAYRISKSGETLTISHKERSEPLYVATDHRETGGIISISQFNLTAEDKKIIQGHAQYLQEQSRKRSLQVERGGFELGD